VAAIEAISGPQEEAQAMAKSFEKRALWTFEALNRADGISCRQPRGAFYVFPNITETGLGSEEMQERLLAEADIAVVAGTSFGMGGEGHIRISCAASEAELEEAVTRIESFLNGVAS
jgi:aspartate/methionine/tyrosine aminotransferase